MLGNGWCKLTLLTCRAARKDGSPCVTPARESGYCFAHDPALAAKRKAAHYAGGVNKGAGRRLAKLTPHSLKPVLTALFEALQGLQDGTIEPRQGSAMAAVAGAIVRCYETAQLEAALAETQARLAALERYRPA
jgi:Family of unknown function (DUF5763)